MPETSTCPIFRDLSLQSGCIRTAFNQIRRDLKFCRVCESFPCDGVRRLQDAITQASAEVLDEIHAEQPRLSRTRLTGPAPDFP